MYYIKFFLFSICCTLMINTVKAEEITILHINDHHSHLRADGRMSLKLDGEKTRVKSGGFPAIVSTFKNLSKG